MFSCVPSSSGGRCSDFHIATNLQIAMHIRGSSNWEHTQATFQLGTEVQATLGDSCLLVPSVIGLNNQRSECDWHWNTGHKTSGWRWRTGWGRGWTPPTYSWPGLGSHYTGRYIIYVGTNSIYPSINNQYNWKNLLYAVPAHIAHLPPMSLQYLSGHTLFVKPYP